MAREHHFGQGARAPCRWSPSEGRQWRDVYIVGDALFYYVYIAAAGAATTRTPATSHAHHPLASPTVDCAHFI